MELKDIIELAGETTSSNPFKGILNVLKISEDTKKLKIIEKSDYEIVAEYQGSGKKPYLISVTNLGEFNCECRAYFVSKSQPKTCKHSLGLLLKWEREKGNIEKFSSFEQKLKYSLASIDRKNLEKFLYEQAMENRELADRLLASNKIPKVILNLFV